MEPYPLGPARPAKYLSVSFMGGATLTARENSSARHPSLEIYLYIYKYIERDIDTEGELADKKE